MISPHERASPPAETSEGLRRPLYLIEEVELDVRLAPRAARVAAKLRLRPNPKVATGGKPLQLDGEGLALESVALDGKALPLVGL